MGAGAAVHQDDLASAISSLGSPVVVGISGFGGSGKSTLATWLAQSVPGWVRVRGDDFLDPSRSHSRSPDWSGVDRVRLAREVLDPFRRGQPGQHQPYDWAQRRLGAPVANPEGEVLVVDLIGLFHPEILDLLDVRVWMDLDLPTATERGLQRDAELGRDHRALWRDVWVPNERDFERNFAPKGAATHIFRDTPGHPLTAVSD
jgi:uridine kinase